MEASTDDYYEYFTSSQVSYVYTRKSGGNLPSEFGDEDALLSHSTFGDPERKVCDSVSSHLDTSFLEPAKPSELRQPEHPNRWSLDDRFQDHSPENPKLEFESLGLIRRDKEMSSLQLCLERSVQSSGRELVFLSGMSGAGKTSVAETVKEHVTKHEDGTFVQGKFDLNTNDEPYSGIAKAIGKICGIIKEKPEQMVASIAVEISLALGDEIEFFLNLIPELKEIATEYTPPAMSADADIQEVVNGIERLRYTFRALIRALSHHLSPMVIVLDDLHWADISSLQVLDFVISDVQNPNQLMIIGCYRSNEADENSLLYNKIMALQEKASQYHYNLTEIEISGLREEDVSTILEKILPSQSDEKTQQLASLSVKRTLGNPFFIIEFLKMLQTERLVVYDAVSRTWDWDISTIENLTMSTSNVVVLLQSRMKKLESHVQRFLQCAACLGSSFTLPMLGLVWRKFNMINTTDSSRSLNALLALAEKEQFLETCDEQRYRWIHDKVQEAALTLTGTVRPEFQFDAGSTLYYCLQPQHLEDALFNVTDLINSGNTRKRPEFASLNLRAAEKARSLSALQSAAKYASHGIELLQEERWSSGRSLTLRLFTMGYEMELAVGNTQVATVYGREVLSQESCTIMEKLPLKIAQLGKQCYVDMEFETAIDSCLSLMKELGCSLIWNKRTVPLQALTVLHRTIQKAKRAPEPKTILDAVGKMTDQRYLAQMQLAGALCYAAYQADLTYLNAIGMCKLIELTLKYGVADNSGTAFTGLGMLMIALQEDFSTAARFAETGLALQENVGPARDATAMFTAYALVLAWYRDIASIQPVMDEIYVKGMQVGDSTYAIWALLTGRVWIPFMMGLPLGPILEQCPLLATQMQELNQTEQFLLLKVVWQMISDLTSSSESSQLMEGEVFRHSECKSTNGMYTGMLGFAHGELWLHWDLKSASERAISSPNQFAKSCPAVFLGQLETFHRGVALYEMARTNKGSRQYATRGNKVRRKLQKWVQAGNPNAILYHKFLSAEHAALKRKHDKATKLYEEVIELATKKNDLRHLALFHERFATFLFIELKDKVKHDEQIQEAIRTYEEWGCTKKATELKRSVITSQ